MKKVAAFILIVVLGLNLSSCTNQPSSSKETPSTTSMESSSKTIETTTATSSQTGGMQTTALSVERPTTTSSATTSSATTSSATTATVASVNWDGPVGYTIVIPTVAEREILQVAERLKAFYMQKYQVDLPIVKDSQKESDKENL